MAEAEDSATAIAVIGYAGRFPGAPDVETFWRNLRDGVESISFFSRDDVEAAGVDPAELDDPDYVRAGGRLDGIEAFDAEHFGYSPREAELMDPQQRLFLETAWEALENAGYPPRGRSAPVGVYGGMSLNTYLLNNLYAGRNFVHAMNDLGTLIGNDKDFLTTRVSYKLDLTGPSVVVQTACSTSLVAITEACQSLLTHQCDMALAGGVSVRVPQERGYRHESEGIFSPDGHCRAFDARAAGTVFGNGVGIAVLKRLDQALADRDTIRAVVRGFAVNNDGAGKVGYTAPSVERQAEVVAMAMTVAGVEPASVSYVEAHGTGTELGDPIEIAALNAAFGDRGGRRASCGLGSVKTNIGHLDAAAGVASFLKTVLALEHRQLPPSLHFERPNPAIDFDGGPFYVNASLRDWSTDGSPRRAGVSSLGIGGTNAHVVLEEAPPEAAADPSRPQQLVLISARTAEALEAASQRLAARFEQRPQISLANAAYTLQVGRIVMPHRRALVCDSPAAAAAGLRTPGSPAESSLIAGAGRQVAFLFPGQGAQHPDMARGIYDSEPEFRRHVDQCAAILEPLLGSDLREPLFPAAGDETVAARQIERTILAQPAIFVVSYALARLWMSWGIRPEAMIGHSMGELVAACLAGVFSLPEALQLVATRGKLVQSLPGGAMLAVELTADEAREQLRGDLALAAVNAPRLCVISGPTPVVRELESRLTAEGVASRRLHTSHAFHSPMMDPVLDDLAAAVRAADPRPPELPFISGASGDWITAAEATDPDYWAQQLRRTVQFSRGLRCLARASRRTLLEVGPGATLAGLARTDEALPPVVSSLPHPERSDSDSSQLLRALGQLWLAGAELDWQGFYAHERRQRIPLPTYPFERRRHWIEAPASWVEASGPVRRQSEERARESAVDRPGAASDRESTDGPRTELERDLAERWRKLLGVERVGIHDNFFELGGHSLLATQLINRIEHDYPDAELSLRALFDGPTVAEMAAVISGAGAESPEVEEGLTRTRLLRAAAEERHDLLESYLDRRLADVGAPESSETGSSAAGVWHDSSSAVGQLLLALERDLGLRAYPHELRRHGSISDLAGFILAEIDLLERGGVPRVASDSERLPAGDQPSGTAPAAAAGGKNDPAILLLSAPRSGSTLLRVMLSGHSGLFCPPELALLRFRTMSEWSQDDLAELHREGLLRAFAALLDVDAADRLVAEMIERDLPTAEIYATLQERARPRVLVDKTPVYAYHRSTLRRAEDLFERPAYVHLVRHPYTVIDSFVRARFDRLLGEPGNSYEIAERYWRRSNRNVLGHARRLGRDRCHLIRFETLVREPESEMRELCEFLDLPFEETLLRPYEAGEMFAGPGDPNLFAHGRIDPDRAERWREIALPEPLTDASRELAHELGYELP